jgi:hypothetical protein
MELYPEILKVLRNLLEKSHHSHWVNWIDKDIEEWNKNKNTRHHLSAYGGMGSINDLWVGGHNLNGTWENEIFDNSKSLAYTLAQKRGIGSSELVRFSINPNGKAIEGWRCLECGYSEISKIGIESYIANKFVPHILKEKIENNELDTITEIRELRNLEQVVIIRNNIISTIKNTEIELTEKTDKWTEPCPSCESKNKAVYRWNYIGNSELKQIIPSENNLKIKNEKITLPNTLYKKLLAFINLRKS